MKEDTHCLRCHLIKITKEILHISFFPFCYWNNKKEPTPAGEAVLVLFGFIIYTPLDKRFYKIYTFIADHIHKIAWKASE